MSKKAATKKKIASGKYKNIVWQNKTYVGGMQRTQYVATWVTPQCVLDTDPIIIATFCQCTSYFGGMFCLTLKETETCVVSFRLT